MVARVTEDNDGRTADDVVDSVTDVTCKEVYYVVEENSNKKLLIRTLKVLYSLGCRVNTPDTLRVSDTPY